MPIINLRSQYPHLSEDIFMEISDPIFEVYDHSRKQINNYDRRARYHRAFYSLDVGDGIPLSLLEFIHEAHPLGLPGVQITGSAQGSGDIISADDILRQVGGHGIAHLTRQVEHGGLFFVCEEEDLSDLLQFLHFRRVAATLLNVTEVGCGYMEHFGHFSERYLLFLPFPL